MMPYKEKEKQKNYWKDKKRQQRDVHPDNVHPDLSTPEMVPASYVEGLNGRVDESLPERPRYLTLTDGQVLDRLNPPVPISYIDLRACNESSYNYTPNRR